MIVVSDSSAHRASNASDSCVSLPPFSWASLVSNEVHWRFAIYVPWHRTGTYLVIVDEEDMENPERAPAWSWGPSRGGLG